MMETTKTIRVMVVDDHAVVRSGLAAFLNIYLDFELVGEARNGEQAVVECATLQPDVVLMDLVMPVKDGIWATREIRKRYPCVQVIALTSFHDESSVRGALEAGANGYLLKNISADDLARAIHSVAQGSPSLSPEATGVLIHAANNPRPPCADLTEREVEVLTCLVEGLSNTEIARKLILSHGTVKFHVSNILSKLGASSRTEAVARAMTHHLV
jgi:NarL family two-component system response regulator LiaR